MVKAAAGGGGRGMRLVHELSELETAIDMAQWKPRTLWFERADY